MMAWWLIGFVVGGLLGPVVVLPQGGRMGVAVIVGLVKLFVLMLIGACLLYLATVTFG